MADYVAIKITKCTLYLTEAELVELLARDPDLHRQAIKRGKAFTRATQTRTRVKQKLDEHRR